MFKCKKYFKSYKENTITKIYKWQKSWLNGKHKCNNRMLETSVFKMFYRNRSLDSPLKSNSVLRKTLKWDIWLCKGKEQTLFWKRGGNS